MSSIITSMHDEESSEIKNINCINCDESCKLCNIAGNINNHNLLC